MASDKKAAEKLPYQKVQTAVFVTTPEEINEALSKYWKPLVSIKPGRQDAYFANFNIKLLSINPFAEPTVPDNAKAKSVRFGLPAGVQFKGVNLKEVDNDRAVIWDIKETELDVQQHIIFNSFWDMLEPIFQLVLNEYTQFFAGMEEYADYDIELIKNSSQVKFKLFDPKNWTEDVVNQFNNLKQGYFQTQIKCFWTAIDSSTQKIKIGVTFELFRQIQEKTKFTLKRKKSVRIAGASQEDPEDDDDFEEVSVKKVKDIADDE